MLVSVFEQIFQALSAHKTARFFLIWSTITAAAAIGVAAVVGQVAALKSDAATKRSISLVLMWRRVWTPKAIALLTFLTVFLAFYIAMILAWEDFAYYDDEGFSQITLKGQNYPLQIIPGTGRFLPLGEQEFNLVRHFTNSVIGYHVLPIVQLLVFFLILVILDGELSITARATLAILALLTPSILTTFSGLIFDERNVLFYLVCFMLFVKQFEQTGSIAWAVAATVAAQIMLYCKETAFLLLLGFAVGRLILRCRNGHHAGWDYNRLSDKESRLDWCFVFLMVLFFVYYFAEMGIHGNINYAVSARQPRAELVLGYIRIDLLAGLFVAVLLARIYLILRHRLVPLLFWDGQAIGGLVFFLAYLYLSIFGIYYLAPMDLIAVLYVGRFTVLSWTQMCSWAKIGAMLLASVVLLQDVLVSAYGVFERKNVIRAKVEIASVVETRYRNNEGNSLRLFFPFAAPYVIMEFASYLNYRGLPVEGAVDGAAGPISVVLATRAGAKDGPCVEWVRIRCHAVSGPAPGDLVIVLPDDDVSTKEASVYRERGELLFSYEPRPPIPPWLSSLFGSLHIGTTRYRHKTLPDRWMDGSVTTWK
jgi:hypothetical protein